MDTMPGTTSSHLVLVKFRNKHIPSPLLIAEHIPVIISFNSNSSSIVYIMAHRQTYYRTGTLLFRERYFSLNLNDQLPKIVDNTLIYSALPKKSQLGKPFVPYWIRCKNNQSCQKRMLTFQWYRQILRK